MPNLRHLDLDELVNRPGTYYNPQTEVMIIVDDSPEVEQEIFEGEDLDAAEWILISDAVPVDESSRDQLIESFQVQQSAARAPAGFDDEEEEEIELDEDELASE
ncbi:MAG TPA: hypothetical protein VKU89_08845 [Solirubrobacteraceae bacterium]|nr:hypothetical protein [Solirubrobacteraceae bacterium]